MKVHKVVLLVVDTDNMGAEGIKEVVESERYPNRCISPRVMAVETRDVEWTDAHPLNRSATSRAEFARLFGGSPNLPTILTDHGPPGDSCFSGLPCRLVEGTVSCADCDFPRAYVNGASYSAGIEIGAVLLGGVPMRTITNPDHPAGEVTIVRRGSQGPVVASNIIRETYTLPGYPRPDGAA